MILTRPNKSALARATTVTHYLLVTRYGILYIYHDVQYSTVAVASHISVAFHGRSVVCVFVCPSTAGGFDLSPSEVYTMIFFFLFPFSFCYPLLFVFE